MSIIDDLVKDDKPRYSKRSGHDWFLGHYGIFDIYYDSGRWYTDYTPPCVIVEYGFGYDDFFITTDGFDINDSCYQAFENALQEAHRRAKLVDSSFYVYQFGSLMKRTKIAPPI